MVVTGEMKSIGMQNMMIARPYTQMLDKKEIDLVPELEIISHRLKG